MSSATNDAAGLCRTDLHIIEGELPPHKSPLTPGHQIVGVAEGVGEGVSRFEVGGRVGVPWLHRTCGKCEFCLRGKENLCSNALFTGYDVDGGYAQYTLAYEDFAYPIPPGFPDLQAAPLLCAGVIGYRALRLAEVPDEGRLGLYGFGASAHIVIQIAVHLGYRVYVFSRSEEHRKLARELGAVWTGPSQDGPPEKLHSAIIFAPAGNLVPVALEGLEKGGTVALAGIYMSPVPELEYNGHLYHEKTLSSAANSTREDVEEILRLAVEIPIHTEIQAYPLEAANKALSLLKAGAIQGAAVLEV
ncbi:MAG: zinc-dependent alcohol dehydrogenase family protein [Dehalococcoidia bacterium]